MLAFNQTNPSSELHHQNLINDLALWSLPEKNSNFELENNFAFESESTPSSAHHASSLFCAFGLKTTRAGVCGASLQNPFSLKSAVKADFLTLEPNIKGSITSNNGNINITSRNDTNITALKSTANSSTKSEGFTQSITIGASYGQSMAQKAVESLMAQMSVRSSKSDNSNVNYTNTTLLAQNGSLTINSGNNAAIKGANLLAQDTTLNTQNNLSVESLQNSTHNKSKSKSIGAGGGSSFSLNYNSSKSSFDRDWVDDQTTVIGTNSININTGNNTHIKGAVIANSTNGEIGESAIDGGNLTMNTGSLTTEDIFDSEKQKSSSIGLGITINTSRTPSSQESNSFPKGSLSIALQNEGYIKEQTTKATIGNGNITVGSTQVFDTNPLSANYGNLISSTGGSVNNPVLLGDLNRDIAKSQVITKDTITGALDINTTIDLRLLDITGKGQKQIWNELKRLPENIPLIPVGLGIDIFDVTTSLTNQDKDKNSNIGFFKTLDNKLQRRYDSIYKPKELTKSANDDKAKYYADKNNPDASFYNTETGESYFNLARITGNDDLIEKALHEGLHPNEKFDGLTPDQEERMVRAETDKLHNTLNFYYNLGNSEGNIASQYTSWALSNANYGGVYNDNSNYLNNIYNYSTANVSESSIIANNFAANTVDRSKIETFAPAIPLLAYALSGTILTNEALKSQGDGNAGVGAYRITQNAANLTSSAYNILKNIDPNLKQGLENLETTTSFILNSSLKGYDTGLSSIFNTDSDRPLTNALVNSSQWFDSLPESQKGLAIISGFAGSLVAKEVGSTWLRGGADGNDKWNTNKNNSEQIVKTDDGKTYGLQKTLDRIYSGEKFPHRNDGSTFANREGLLPKQDPGYYKEYVHPTSGTNGPGAMRVVTGKNGETWFTPDHYKTFIKIK